MISTLRQLRSPFYRFALLFFVLLLTVLLAFGSGGSRAVKAGITSSGFVTRSGANFMLNGNKFYSAGTNNYYVNFKSNYMVDDAFVTASNNNFNVVRVWGFIDCGNAPTAPGQACANSVDGVGHKDGIYYQYWNGTAPAYNDGPDGLQRLDYVLARAKTYGLRLVVTLTNNWRDFGGMEQYARWRGSSHDAFYTDATMKQWYKNYAAHLINRVNTVNGVAYKNDPTIFAWELANEPRSGGATSLITNWASEMSGYIKSLDPNHLVGVGDEGFYCQVGGTDQTNNCTAGVDSIALANIPTVDMMSLHLYPSSWGKDVNWGTTWITDHIRDGHAAGKPVFLGEYGLPGSKDSGYQTWTDAFYNNGGDADLFWMIAAHQDDGSLYPDYDGFTVYCPRSDCTILSTHASKMVTKSGMSSIPPFPSPTRPPTATATATPCGCPSLTPTPTGPTQTPSRTPTATPTAAVNVVDDLNDFSKMFSHSANLTFDASAPNQFGNDTSRLDRTTLTPEWAVWQMNGMNQFKAVTYHWPYEGNKAVYDFTFTTSSNGTTWNPITPLRTTPTGDWYLVVYTLNPPLGQTYVKVSFPASGPTNAWNPQISQVVMGGVSGPTPTPCGSCSTNTPQPLTNTPTRTNTSLPPTNTSTRTNTPIPPTNTSTRTNTPVPPTNTAGPSPTSTRTNTQAPPTNTPTRTNTPLPLTNTPTRTNTPVPPTNTPAPPTNTPGPSPTNSANFRVDANVAVQSSQETQYQIKLFNTSAQAQANLKVRIFFNLTEVYAAGLTSANVLVEKFFDQCGTTFSPVTVWNAAAKTYYIDVSWGSFSFPANSSCEVHVRPRLDGWQTVWDGTNDYSAQGLTSSYATTQKVTAYQNNVRVYGIEPP